MKNRLAIGLMIFLLVFLLAGCNGFSTDPLTSTTSVGPTETTSTSATTSVSDLRSYLQPIYLLAIEADAFEGTYEEWLETVRGPQGDAGREVSFQVASGYIQWQYSGDTEWFNLIALTSLLGPKGDQGEDGLSAYEIYLIYHPEYDGDEEQWIHDLVNGALREVVFSTITFVSNGGDPVSPITQEEGTVVAPPTNPIKEGYTFVGWYSDETLLVSYLFSTMPTEDLTLFASWNEIVVDDDPSNYSFVLKEDDTYEIVGYLGTSTALNLPSSYLEKAVTSIGANAFYGQNLLTSITIPAGVTSIEEFAFTLCSGLLSIELPASLTSIDIYAFYGCSSLTSITIPSNVNVIGSNAFYGCSSLTSISIPYGVTRIDFATFSGCTNLTSITIPDSVTIIEFAAFSQCSSLTSISIPSSVTTIQHDVFGGCDSLSAFIVEEENNNYTAEDGVLFDQSMSTLIKYPQAKIDSTYQIPASVSTIGDSAFYDADHLTDITFEEGTLLTTIGSSAFGDCTNLTNIVIPLSVTTVGSWAFGNCGSLTIHAFAVSKPSGWDSQWNPQNRPVVWGYIS